VGEDAGRGEHPPRAGAVGARELVEWINARVAAKFQRGTDVMIMGRLPAQRRR
jgi:hypothetical protein